MVFDLRSLVITKVSADKMKKQERISSAPITLSLVERPKAGAVDMSYHRTSSPGGRRIQNPARLSDSFTDPYYSQRHTTSYGNPRTSTDRVYPGATQSYSTHAPPTSSGRGSDRYDSYTGRPRGNSLLEQRSNVPPTTQLPSRARPTIVQNDGGRPSSPVNRSHDKDYYLTPAHAPRKSEHKKVYSVDDGAAKLVADVDVGSDKEKTRRKRRDSEERGGYRSSGSGRSKGYHLNGPLVRTEKHLNDDEGYSYTDPASMYKDTEPRWRPRRGSVDRGGASRERPQSLLLEPGYNPRKPARDSGPPPSARGWDKINEGLGRANSLQVGGSSHDRSTSRGRYEQPARSSGMLSPHDPYYVPPRAVSNDRRGAAVNQSGPIEKYEPYADAGHDDRLRPEPRYRPRRHSATRAPDVGVERRGFGIRSDSKDRYGRGSDEDLGRPGPDYPRDSGYIEPPPRSNQLPDRYALEEQRLEQQKRDLLAAKNFQDERADRQYEHDARDRDDRRRGDRDSRRDPEYERERDHDRPKDRDRDHERHKERDRERDRPRERDRGDKDKERHHHRRSTADKETDRERERGYERHTKDSGARDSNDNILPAGAAGVGLGAATAYGASHLMKKHKDRDSDSDRDRDRDREHDKESGRDRERDRERERDRDRLERDERRYEDDRKADRDRDTERRHRHHEPLPNEPPSSARERPQDRHLDPDRGLGFAFEGPSEPTAPRSPREPGRDHPRERERERSDEVDAAPPKPSDPAVVDPDEDYRRRMEQVQRELGRGDERHSSDSDGDRERRRKEREARQREREMSAQPPRERGVGFEQPPPSSHRSFDEEDSYVSGSAHREDGGLRRKPSILDEPMERQDQAQIIDNTESQRRENRVRIVDPPTQQEEDAKPKGILKKPTDKFKEDPNPIREGVAPLKEATKNDGGIPPGARWTKIDRRLVNPEALEDAKERFEERLDHVIVLRVLTKEEIQKFADRTKEIRDERYEQERSERKSQRRKDRNRDRRDRDEFEDDSEDEFKEKPVRMLEAPAGPGAEADFGRGFGFGGLG
ncbi:hypothetical protein MBLNU230_g6905t1 [Neophaeotheca triangularis]